MTARAAEVTKTAENTLRDLQIAAINELALYCEAMGINIYDVRDGIDSLKGEGITRALLWPGAGVGGHCLTKDTYHLERGVQVLGQEALDYPEGERSLFVLARTINDFMPRHMAKLTRDAFSRLKKPVKGARIALLGWAFLANSDDARNTPSEVYHTLMTDDGATVVVHDPLVIRDPSVTIEHDLETAVHDADAVVIFTGHREYRALDPKRVKKLSGRKNPIIVDGRNLIDPGSFIRQGFVYKGIGRGDKNGHAIVKG
jgi:UDP-N-acetyl-D-mannosaminuronic acid dehydrogenase